MKKSLLFATKPVDSEKKLIEKEELEKILLQNFGHSCFRGKQLEAIQAVLSGRDCFCLMPTGGGKSMCYQIPALVKPGIVLVVSPLIALMENQVAALRVHGIRAEFLSSTQAVHAKEKVHEDLDSGKPLVKLLYVTPELIATFGFKSKLTKLHSRGLLSLIAIDEAHCISSWGHDFRPSYRKLSSLRSQLPGVPLLAVTATAVPKVQSDVIESLGLQRPLVLKASFNRPNIFYEVRYKDLLDDVYLDISKLIKSTESACSIIYCLERSACDELSAYLAKKGISCAAYHAGLNNKTRTAVLDRWISYKVQVVVATVAFGMGIDRKDVRIVCHFNIPKSMESFYQESGRAGRDQLPSRSILYYGLDDRKRMEFILSSAHASKKSHSSSSSDVLLNKSMTNFAQMVKYCEGSGCRRKKILESFGEQQPTSFCQKTCDTCMHPNKISAYLGQLSTSQNVCQKIFIKSSFNVSEDSGTEFWNREDEIQSPDDDISDSDDGTEVLEKIRMSKISSKSKVNMKIDALQRAEESYYKKKDNKKQTGVLSNKIIIPDKLREASKIRLLNGLKPAQERSGKLMDLHAASAVLEMECYKKYGKVRKTFYISQVASIIRWLSTSTYEDICNRVNENCTTPHIEVDFSESSSTPQNFAFKEDFPIGDSKEGTNACCNCKPETYFQHPWEKPTLQRNDLFSIPSFSEFVKQNVKAGASKENSQSSIGMQMRNIPRDDAKKRPRLQ